VSEHEAWPGEESSENVLADAEAAAVEEPEEDEPAEEPRLRVAHEHAAGELAVPDDVDLLEGEPRSTRRGVGLVVGRAHGEIANALLGAALAELEAAGVAKDSVTVMAVPGAFELPLGAMALAKTRRYSCIVALGCVVRDETPEFDQVAGEAASGLQLAALETGVPVSFGVLTLDSAGAADGRAEKGAEAVRTALEMADLFAQLRSSAQAQ
jgi:6,7-dimethyl-8-ribityllumazine synthase